MGILTHLDKFAKNEPVIQFECHAREGDNILRHSSCVLTLGNALLEGWPALLTELELERVQKEKPWLLERYVSEYSGIRTPPPPRASNAFFSTDTQELPWQALEYVFRSANEEIEGVELVWYPAKPQYSTCFGLIKHVPKPTMDAFVLFKNGSKIAFDYSDMEYLYSIAALGFDGDQQLVNAFCKQFCEFVVSKEEDLIACRKEIHNSPESKSEHRERC